MVYCGKPSKGCLACRSRKTRCDRATPSCSQCIRAKRDCPGYRNQLDLMFRNESQTVIGKVTTQKARKRKLSPSTTRSSPKPSTPPYTVQPDVHERVYEFFLPLLKQQKYVPNALSPSIEDRALGFYKNREAIWLRNFDLVETICNQSNTDEYLLASLSAVGLASYAASVRSPVLMARARKDYGKALQLTNTALRSPTEFTKDSTLFAVVALGIFEAVAGNGEESLIAWAKHLAGASELVKLRGIVQFRTEAGQRMFFQICSNLMVDCVQYGRTLPKHILLLREGAKPYLDTQETGWRISETIIAFTYLRENVMHKKPDPRVIVQQALKIDREFLDICEKMPPKWHPEIYSSDENPDAIWDREYYIYADFWIAQMQNTMRAFRIHAHQIIREQLVSLSSDFMPVFSGTGSSAMLATSLSVMREMQAQILASIPQYAPWGILSFPISSPVESWHAYHVLWPLFLAGNMDITPPHMQQWVLNRFRVIAKEGGIEHANVLADSMVTRQKALVWEGMDERQYSQPLKMSPFDWKLDGWAIAHGVILSAQINKPTAAAGAPQMPPPDMTGIPAGWTGPPPPGWKPPPGFKMPPSNSSDSQGPPSSFSSGIPPGWTGPPPPGWKPPPGFKMPPNSSKEPQNVPPSSFSGGIPPGWTGPPPPGWKPSPGFKMPLSNSLDSQGPQSSSSSGIPPGWTGPPPPGWKPPPGFKVPPANISKEAEEEPSSGFSGGPPLGWTGPPPAGWKPPPGFMMPPSNSPNNSQGPPSGFSSGIPPGWTGPPPAGWKPPPGFKMPLQTLSQDSQRQPPSNLSTGPPPGWKGPPPPGWNGQLPPSPADTVSTSSRDSMSRSPDGQEGTRGPPAGWTGPPPSGWNGQLPPSSLAGRSSTSSENAMEHSNNLREATSSDFSRGPPPGWTGPPPPGWNGQLPPSSTGPSSTSSKTLMNSPDNPRESTSSDFSRGPPAGWTGPPPPGWTGQPPPSSSASSPETQMNPSNNSQESTSSDFSRGPPAGWTGPPPSGWNGQLPPSSSGSFSEIQMNASNKSREATSSDFSRGPPPGWTGPPPSGWNGQPPPHSSGSFSEIQMNIPPTAQKGPPDFSKGPPSGWVGPPPPGWNGGGPPSSLEGSVNRSSTGPPQGMSNFIPQGWTGPPPPGWNGGAPPSSSGGSMNPPPTGMPEGLSNFIPQGWNGPPPPGWKPPPGFAMPPGYSAATDAAPTSMTNDGHMRRKSKSTKPKTSN